MKKKTKKAIKRILKGKPIQNIEFGWVVAAAVAYIGYQKMRERGMIPENIEQLVDNVVGIPRSIVQPNTNEPHLSHH